MLGVLGLRRGAVKAVFSVAGLVCGIVLAGRYYQALAGILSTGGVTWAVIAAYVIILVTTLIIASVVGSFIARLAHIVMLGWLDKLIGFILGALVGSMLCAALLAIVSKLPGTEGAIAHSIMAKLLMERIPLLLALLPDEFDFIRGFFS